MDLLHFIARRYLSCFIIGAFIFASNIGCERLRGSSDDLKLTVHDPRGRPSGLYGRSGAAGADMLANRNPDTQPLISHDELLRYRMAPRLESLDNKTIYLVDTGFAGGTEFFEEMHRWFNENMPSVKIVVHPKPGNAFADSPEFWPLLKQKADGVVFGVGG